jgi:tetratricopeptide (TPR) repeat protein
MADLWAALFDAAGGDPRAREAWRAAIAGVLADTSPGAIPSWVAEHASTFEPALVAALWDLSRDLLSQPTLDATRQMLDLDGLMLLIALHAPGEVPQELLLVVLHAVETGGCGPRHGEDEASQQMRAFNYRGCMLAEHQELAPAREHFTACVDLDPAFAPAYCNRIRVCLELGDRSTVDADCATLEGLDPDYVVAAGTLELVQALRRFAEHHEGSTAELAAKHGLLDFLRTYDRPPRPSELGQTLAELPNPFELAPLAADATVEELNHHGVVLGRSGRYQEAVDALTAGIELDTGYDRLYFNRGNALRLAKRYDEALADLSTYVTRAPADPGGFTLRALVLRDLGRDREAEADEAAARLWSSSRES